MAFSGAGRSLDQGAARGRRALRGLSWLALAWLGLCGCGGTGPEKWYQPGRSSSEYLDMALDAEHADQRRRGVIGLSSSRDGSSEWAVKTFDALARRDSDAMVRWTALGALAKARAGASTATALKLLRSEEATYEDVRPAPVIVRRGAARLLHALSDARATPAEMRSEIIETVLASLKRERDHQLRLALIDAMGYYPERVVADRLVELLEDEDFAVQRSAEYSLARMTGVTHRYDAEKWRAFFDHEAEPFARGGTLPEELVREPDKPRWDWLNAG